MTIQKVKKFGGRLTIDIKAKTENHKGTMVIQLFVQNGLKQRKDKSLYLVKFKIEFIKVRNYKIMLTLALGIIRT